MNDYEGKHEPAKSSSRTAMIAYYTSVNFCFIGMTKLPDTDMSQESTHFVAQFDI